MGQYPEQGKVNKRMQLFTCFILNQSILFTVAFVHLLNRANLLLKYLIIAILYEPFTVSANAFTTMSIVIHVDTFHPTIARENTSIIKVV